MRRIKQFMRLNGFPCEAGVTYSPWPPDHVICHVCLQLHHKKWYSGRYSLATCKHCRGAMVEPIPFSELGL